MTPVLRIAFDLLREAFRRKWFIALFGSISVVLLALAFTLELDMVDGALAGARLFGKTPVRDIVPGGTVLDMLNYIVGGFSFYAGALFLCVACSDFAAELLAPGRIEHLLSLPVQRWQLLLGTYVGVLALAASGALYGASGLAVLMGLKSGLWSGRLIIGSLIACVGFAAIYAAMLAMTVIVRSAAFAAAIGLITLVFGMLASNRESIAMAMEAGPGRWAFRALVMPFPRFQALGEAAANIAGHEAVYVAQVVRLLVGCLVFAAGLLSFAVWRFEQKDY